MFLYTDAFWSVKRNELRKKTLETENDVLPQLLIASLLTALWFVAVGARKSVSTKFCITIEVMEQKVV